MLSDVLGYVGNYPNQVIYSHYETGNEILMRNISGKTFYCQRLHNVTNVKSNRVLAVTQMQIIEMAVNPFKTGFGTVLEVYNLEGLSKIKFKKTSSGVLTLTFNSNNVLQYVMTDPISCVDYIKIKMQLIGMKGDLTKSLIHSKHIETATSFFEATKEIEAQFSLKPSYKLIEKIMDLLREATEQFAEGSDDRYLSVIKHIQKFLQREDVTRILDIGPTMDPHLIAVDDVRTCEILNPSADTIVEISRVDACRSTEGGSSVEPCNQVHIKPADDGDFSKYEEELAALMTPGDNTPNEEGDRNVVAKDNSSIDAEVDLKSMLGDITEEFTTLMNSFEKPIDKPILL
jgi:hypothetical protein